MAQQLAISLPSGSLGVIIRQETNGQCVVTTIINTTLSPLLAGDVILNLNGIVLADVEGGVPTWQKLFGAFSSMPRNLIVWRSPPSVVAVAATAIPSKKLQPAAVSWRPAASQPQPQPDPSQPPHRQPVGYPNKAPNKASWSHNEQALARMSDKPNHNVWMAANGYNNTPGALASSSSNNNKKHALKPPSHGNSTTTTLTKKNKKAKTTKSKIIRDWNHDDNYMRMLREGFRKYSPLIVLL